MPAEHQSGDALFPAEKDFGKRRRVSKKEPGNFSCPAHGTIEVSKTSGALRMLLTLS